MEVSKEKPTPLGSRVYKRHRKMVVAMVRKDRSQAEVVREAIEEKYDREITNK